MIVPGKKYSALIQGYPNDTSGLYPVFISELHAIDKSLTTIKVKNKLSNYGKWMYEGKVYSSGSYIPLHPGMTVTVVFLTASALSGSITEIHYDHTPFDKINQVGIHLIAKTPGGSQIYLDDSRGVTHIMHNNGRTNALLSDDKISLSVNETSNVGSNFISGVEVGKEGIFLKFGTTSISINESGIAFKVGEAEYIFDDKALKANTENVNLNIKNFELKSNKTFITAEEEAHLKSTVTRVTGGQYISLTGNVIGVDSNLHTSLRSGVSVSIDSLSHIDIDSTIINMDALGTVAVRGTAALLSGVETVVNGVTTAINGSNIFEDSMIIRGMGVASSLSAGLVGSTMGTKMALKASDAALTTAFHFNDPFSGMAANVMTETLPGVAQGVPIQMPTVVMNPSFDYTNNYIQYIKKAHVIGDIGSVDMLKSLAGNKFKSIYMGENNASSI